MKKIASKISQLSPELVDELDRYLDHLINKQKVLGQKKLRQDWAGGLKETEATSVELQKRALDWREKQDI